MTTTTPAAPTSVSLRISRRDGFHLDVDLELAAGTTTALVGPNGAGKSTVVGALAGLLPIDDGRIEIAGDVVDDPAAGVFVEAAQRRTGVVFQDGLLFDHLDVRDNVAFGPRSRGADRDEARRVAQAWLDRLAIADLAHRRPTELSGGQAQRVALARALVTEPRLVLLDEPLAALDVRSRTQLRRLLGEHLPTLAAPRLLVTHDPVEAFLLADSIAVLEDGSITQVGSAAELRARPRTAYAAELVGVNLVRGTGAGGEVVVDGGDGDGGVVLTTADTGLAGEVLVTVPPQAIALSLSEPAGSQRNTWRTTVAHLEPFGGRVRVTTGAPLPLTAEVTPSAVADLGLAAGVTVWLAIKATELRVASIG